MINAQKRIMPVDTANQPHALRSWSYQNIAVTRFFTDRRETEPGA
ncbi:MULTISPECIES: hypothetical protein [Streptomyces]|nr:hypothetical protein [Streptomyces ruber]